MSLSVSWCFVVFCCVQPQVGFTRCECVLTCAESECFKNAKHMFSNHKKECGQVDHAKASLMSPTALNTRVSPWFHLVRGRVGTVGVRVTASQDEQLWKAAIWKNSEHEQKHLVDLSQKTKAFWRSESMARGANLPAKHVD